MINKNIILSIFFFAFVVALATQGSAVLTIDNGFYDDINTSNGLVKNALYNLSTNAYDFNGVNSYLNLSTNSYLNWTEDYSLTFWIYINNKTSTPVPYIIDFGQGTGSTKNMYLYWSSATNLRWEYNNLTGSSGTTVTTNLGDIPYNSWHFVALIHNSTTRSYSIDGTYVSATEDRVQRNSGNTMQLFGGSTVYNGYFNGSVDDIRIYSRDLNTSDVVLLNNTRAKNLSNLNNSLVSYYSFEDAGFVNIGGSGILNLSYLSTNISDNNKLNYSSTDKNLLVIPLINITSSTVNLSITSDDISKINLFSLPYKSRIVTNGGLVNISNVTITSFNGSGIDTNLANVKPSLIFFQNNLNPVYISNSNLSYLGGYRLGTFYEFGVMLINANNSNIKNNIFSGNGYGFVSRLSDHTDITNNTVFNIHSNGTAITEGIELAQSKWNNVIDNTIFDISRIDTQDISAGVHCSHTCDNSIIRNNNISLSETGILFWDNSNNITVINNILNNLYVEGIRIESGAYNSIISNNTIKSTSLNPPADLINVSAAINIFNGNSEPTAFNVTVSNNYITNFTRGIFAEGKNITIINNILINQKVQEYGLLLELNNSIINNNSLTKLNIQKSVGISIKSGSYNSISNINFNNVSIAVDTFYDNTGGIRNNNNNNFSSLIFNNISILGWRFRSNISNWVFDNSYFKYSINNLVGNGGDTVNSTENYPFNYNNIILNNTLGINISFTILNQTNSLIYTSNGTAYQGSGNINITLQPNNYSYVLDNFNLTEGNVRAYSPLWFSSSSSSSTTKTWDIASNLTVSVDGIVTTVYIPRCSTVKKFTFTPDSGNNVQTLRQGEFTCDGDYATMTLDHVEPAQNSNHLVGEYGACSTFERTGYRIILIAGALLIVGFVLTIMWKNGIIEEMTVGQLILMVIGILVGIVLLVASGNLIGDSCVV